MTPEVPYATPHLFMGMDVPWLLRHQAERRAEHPFLVWEPFDAPPVAVTYARFRARVRQLAAALARRGVKPGERVLLHLDNCPEMLVGWYACAEIGAVGVTTNTRSALPELAFFAENCGAVAAITQPAYAALVNDAAPRLAWIAVTDHDAGAPAPRAGHADRFATLMADGEGRAAPERAPDPLLPVAIQYTSGTTSRPKGVVWTHANALWGARINASHQMLSQDAVHQVVLPLFHTNAQAYSVLAALWAGATAVIQPRFSSSRFWAVAQRNGTTFANLASFCVRALMNVEVPKAHTLRWIGMGKWDPAVETHFSAKVLSWWGMTETISHGLTSNHPQPVTLGAIGRPAPEYGVDILREDGTHVAPGEIGDLLIRGVRGVSLFLEYFRNPQATADAYDEAGRFRTGDRVRLDAEGCIHFADRAKDMLKVGGENVASSEIEAVIMTVAGVGEAAVVAKPHAMLDEVPVAFVLLKDGAPEAEVVARIGQACAARLADFKRPVEIRVLPEFPRSTLEKIAKAQLRALLG